MIRKATSADSDSIRGLHLQAFSGGEEQLVATLAVNLLSEETHPETISLVAEVDGSVVGHIAFSPVTVDVGKNAIGYILGPLGVRPDYQQQRIGSRLVESGLKQLPEQGAEFVLVYGDPAYYGKFGFKAEAAARFLPPYELQYPFGWQAIILNEADASKQPARISCVASLRDPALW